MPRIQKSETQSREKAIQNFMEGMPIDILLHAHRLSVQLEDKLASELYYKEIKRRKLRIGRNSEILKGKDGREA